MGITSRIMNETFFHRWIAANAAHLVDSNECQCSVCRTEVACEAYDGDGDENCSDSDTIALGLKSYSSKLYVSIHILMMAFILVYAEILSGRKQQSIGYYSPWKHTTSTLGRLAWGLIKCHTMDNGRHTRTIQTDLGRGKTLKMTFINASHGCAYVCEWEFLVSAAESTKIHSIDLKWDISAAKKTHTHIKCIFDSYFLGRIYFRLLEFFSSAASSFSHYIWPLVDA